MLEHWFRKPRILNRHIEFDIRERSCRCEKSANDINLHSERYLHSIYFTIVFIVCLIRKDPERSFRVAHSPHQQACLRIEEETFPPLIRKCTGNRKNISSINFVATNVHSRVLFSKFQVMKELILGFQIGKLIGGNFRNATSIHLPAFGTIKGLLCISLLRSPQYVKLVRRNLSYLVISRSTVGQSVGSFHHASL